MICASRTTSTIMSTLDTLPLEILFSILDVILNPHDPSSSSSHPLNSLAAANKHFDSAVHEYTRVLLKQHTNFAPKKKSKSFTSRRKWLAETCQLCYKTSKRRSTLWSNLTCCLACDKMHFPKVVRCEFLTWQTSTDSFQTMTNSIKRYNLSKLDLFTPNRLHPALSPLAHGEYPVMGGVATSTHDQRKFAGYSANNSVIYEPDLLARRDYLHHHLGILHDPDNICARKRVRRHDQLIIHMEVAYSTSRKVWYRSPQIQSEVRKSVKKSMQTEESRETFVQNTLASERASMYSQDMSEETAIELC